MKGRWFGGRFETLDQHLMVPELKKGWEMGALHHFSASAVAREGPCEGARGCLLTVFLRALALALVAVGMQQSPELQNVRLASLSSSYHEHRHEHLSLASSFIVNLSGIALETDWGMGLTMDSGTGFGLDSGMDSQMHPTM